MEPPMVSVFLGNTRYALVEGGQRGAQMQQVMDLLGRQFGFLVEVGTSATRTPKAGDVRTYQVQAFDPPQLPGVFFRKEVVEGVPVVRILPDYHREVVVEDASEPKSGLKQFIDSDPMQFSQEAAVLKSKKAIEATKDRLVESFVANVERIRLDNGYKRAWFIRYRYREASAIPKGSPFWDLCDQVVGRESSFWAVTGVVPNPQMMESLPFWKAKGQATTHGALRQYLVVAFEGRDGKLARLEGWKAYLPE